MSLHFVRVLYTKTVSPMLKTRRAEDTLLSLVVIFCCWRDSFLLCMDGRTNDSVVLTLLDSMSSKGVLPVEVCGVDLYWNRIEVTAS